MMVSQTVSGVVVLRNIANTHTQSDIIAVQVVIKKIVNNVKKRYTIKKVGLNKKIRL